MFVQAHCYDDGASFTYMPSTGPSLDPSAPPAPPRWPGAPAPPPPSSVTPQDLEVYWSHQYGDSQLPALREVYPLADYEEEAAYSQASGYGHTAAEYAGFRTETDFAYACTARWASEYFSAVSPVYELQFAFGAAHSLCSALCPSDSVVSDAGYDQRAGVEDESATVRHGAELSFVFSQPDTDNSGAAVEDMAEPVRFGAPVFDMRYLTRRVCTGPPRRYGRRLFHELCEDGRSERRH